MTLLKVIPIGNNILYLHLSAPVSRMKEQARAKKAAYCSIPLSIITGTYTHTRVCIDLCYFVRLVCSAGKLNRKCRHY